MPNTPRIVLIACLLLLAVPGHAQAQATAPDDPPAGADDPPETANPAESPEPAPAATPAAPEDDPEAGSTAPDTADPANRQLKAGGEAFGVRVLPITGGPAQGVLVLVPGDGHHPMSSRGIADLQTGMRAFGWSTWLPELRSPPRIHGAALEDRGQGPLPQQSQAVVPAAAAPSLEADRALELEEWASHSRARLAAVVAEAGGEGRVVLVAEGTAAALLTGLAADRPSAPFALVLLDPVELPGLPATWPKGSAIPVLEVFDHSAQRTQATARRAQAKAQGLHSYRQTVLSLDGSESADSESLLARRLRGWLSNLEQQAAR